MRGGANSLDVLRLVAATMVVFSHSWLLGFGADAPGEDWPREPFHVLTRGQTDAGKMAVDFFFLISGLLVSQSWVRSRGLGEYLRKRVLRIYPGFVCSVLFTILVLVPVCSRDVAHYFASVSWRSVVYRTGFLQSVHVPLAFPDAPFPGVVNGALWSICHEFVCYLLVAGVGLLGVLGDRRAMLALLLASPATLGWQTYVDPGLLPDRELGLFGKAREWPRLLSFFAAGMCARAFADVLPLRRSWFLAATAILALACWEGLKLALPVAGAYAVLYIGFRWRFGTAWVARHGDLSYGVYLYGWPVQQVCVSLWPGALRHQPWRLFPVAMLFTLGLAFLSWRLVEHPCLRWKVRRGAQ